MPEVLITCAQRSWSFFRKAANSAGVSPTTSAPSDFMRVEFKTDPGGAGTPFFREAMKTYSAAENATDVKFTNAQMRLTRLIVAGGVGANRALRSSLADLGQRLGARVYYPRPALCTDNGAMIAFAAALRSAGGLPASSGAFSVHPRWELAVA